MCPLMLTKLYVRELQIMNYYGNVPYAKLLVCICFCLQQLTYFFLTSLAFICLKLNTNPYCLHPDIYVLSLYNHFTEIVFRTKKVSLWTKRSKQNMAITHISRDNTYNVLESKFIHNSLSGVTILLQTPAQLLLPKKLKVSHPLHVSLNTYM